MKPLCDKSVFHTTRFNVIQIEHGDKLALYQGGAG